MKLASGLNGPPKGPFQETKQKRNQDRTSDINIHSMICFCCARFLIVSELIGRWPLLHNKRGWIMSNKCTENAMLFILT